MALLLCNLFNSRHFFHDDAFIELRYARNLIDAGQPVWNLGEKVEGFTSILHLLLVSFLGSLGLALPSAAQVVNFVALGILLGSVAIAGKLATPREERSSAIGLLFIAGSAPLAIWTWGGLEAVLVAAWVGTALIFVRQGFDNIASNCCFQKMLIAGGFYSLAVLTRPDSILLAVGCALGILLGTAELSLHRRFQLILGVLLPVLLTQCVILGFRWVLYDELVPNTYYAKVAGIPILFRLKHGARYLLKSTIEMPVIPVLLICSLYLRRELRSPWHLALLMQLALFLGYVVWVGGDHMTAARFLVPLLPIMGAFLISLLDFQSHAPRLRLQGVLYAGVVLTVALGLARPSLAMDPAAWVGRIVGEYMEHEWPKGSLIALNTAGAPPYYARSMRFIDMLGLNDAHIAHRKLERVEGGFQELPGHAKGDGTYVIARQPDFIVAGTAEGQLIDKSEFMGDREIASLENFRTCYREEDATIPYSESIAHTGPERPNPLRFVYYRRTCPVTVADYRSTRPK